MAVTTRTGKSIRMKLRDAVGTHKKILIVAPQVYDGRGPNPGFVKQATGMYSIRPKGAWMTGIIQIVLTTKNE